MPVNDELGKRMKEFYEQVPKTKLVRRMPVIIRIDGRAFHTFTRGFQKPFDETLINSMQQTMEYLCENIQGCVFGYTQSDEISLVLVDYKTLESGAWFDYEVQKMCSIAASMTTMVFNREFDTYVKRHDTVMNSLKSRFGEGNKKIKEGLNYLEAYYTSVNKGAMFDARCFNIPKEEVTNCIYWRQLDAIRNSIQMVGQAHFSQKQLQNKSCEDIKKMLVDEKNICWDDLLIHQQRGSSCIKDIKGRWYIDTSMPILKGDGREYLEKLINFED